MKAFGLSFSQSENRLYVSPDTGTIRFSDGEQIERELFEVISSARDISATSWELQKSINSWARRYHLSMHRGTIIRSLPFSSDAQVLELGAGCGAITRALGEKFAIVDAIEGSVSRARICASRCRDLLNVRVFAADINKIIPSSAYDIVFLVGVLEWSKGYVTAINPFKRCLEIASGSLKEDGVLVVGIENRLGLKYLLGIGEDHCGIEFEGVHGYPTFHEAETFSKAELESMLRESEMAAVRFLYPYPDYKLARVILSDEAVSLCSETIAYWASRSKFEDYLMPERRLNGNQSLITCEVGKAGLLGILSNSFLVLASRREGYLPNMPWAVRSERLTENRSLSSTTTLEQVSGNLQVRKVYPYPIAPEQRPYGSTFRLNCLDVQPFLEGSILELDLLRCAIAGNVDHFFRILRDWIDYIQRHRLSKDGVHLQPEAWDCIPRNLMRISEGAIQAFDLEFTIEDSIKTEELCTRGLLWWYVDNAPWAMPLKPEAKTIRDHLQWAVGRLFPNLDQSRLISRTIIRENSFQSFFASANNAEKISILINSPVRYREQTYRLTAQMRTSQEQLDRLKNHIVIGKVISLWRKLVNPDLP
jgi:hypothetical protein